MECIMEHTIKIIFSFLQMEYLIIFVINPFDSTFCLHKFLVVKAELVYLELSFEFIF